MRNVIVAVGVLVLLAWVFGGDDDGTTESGAAKAASESAVVAVSTGTPAQLTLETGSPQPLTEPNLEAAREFGDWMGSLSRFELDDNYFESGGDWYAQRLRDLADTYPVESSAVPAQLMTAARTIPAGYSALEARAYGDAERSFGEATDALSETLAIMRSDLDALETNTGYRIGADGVKSDWGADLPSRVERWIDGDTVVTTHGTVRLIGIDTPEMSEECSKADDALKAVEQLAPAGTKIVLHDPSSVADEDKYQRRLRYVSLADGTDIGYTLLLNDLAEARYDSQDGYQWHPREKAYRAVGANAGRDATCSWAATVGLVALAEDKEDDFEHDRETRLNDIASVLQHAEEPLLSVVTDAKESHAQADAWAREATSSSDGSGSGGVDLSGYTGCREYAPGGKTWKPIPCP